MNVAHELTFIRPRYKTASALLLLHPQDARYLGHIYIWPSRYPDAADVIGIRASLVELACRTTGKIAEKLIAAALLWAQQYGFRLIDVEQPLPVMQSVLHTLGFLRSRVPHEHYWSLVEPEKTAALAARVFGPEGYKMLDYHCRYPWHQPVLAQPLQLRSGVTEQDTERALSAQIQQQSAREPTEQELSVIRSDIAFLKQVEPYYFRPSMYASEVLGEEDISTFESRQNTVRDLERLLRHEAEEQEDGKTGVLGIGLFVKHTEPTYVQLMKREFSLGK